MNFLMVRSSNGIPRIGYILLFVIIISIFIWGNFEEAEAVTEIELSIENIDHIQRYVILYVEPLENVSEDDNLTVKIGELTFRADYFKSVRPTSEPERKQMEFLNQPIEDRVCLYISSKIADSLGVPTFEKIKKLIYSKKVILTKK